MSPLPAGALHRRPLLSAAALAAVAVPLSGCEDVPLDTSADDGAAQGAPDADPDQTLLDETVRVEAEMLGSLRSLLRTAPRRLRPDVQRTIAVHQAHLDLLGAEPDGPPSAPRLRTSAVAERQAGLSRRHAEAAERASSGPFARVLAAMAAASAQQAEVWRRTAGTTP